jgi:hypothetical protein
VFFIVLEGHGFFCPGKTGILASFSLLKNHQKYFRADFSFLYSEIINQPFQDSSCFTKPCLSNNLPTSRHAQTQLRMGRGQIAKAAQYCNGDMHRTREVFWALMFAKSPISPARAPEKFFRAGESVLIGSNQE